MKNTIHQITFVIALLFLGFQANAQKLTITDGSTSYDDQNRPCIIVQLEPDTKKVKGELKDWMDDKYDIDLKGFGFWRNKDVLKAKEHKIEEVSKNEMDFYAEIVENGKLTEMRIFGSFGYDIHISKEKYPKEYRALRNLTLNFLNDFLPEYYGDRIEDTKEALSDLENEREDLSEDIADNKEEIIELREENVELAEEINEKDAAVKNTSGKLKTEEQKLKAINQKLKAKGTAVKKEN